MNFLKKTLMKIASKLEMTLQHAQGKGSGNESLDCEIKALMTLLAKAEISNPQFFDIGANKGEYTAKLLSINKNSVIYCFEPSKNMLKELSDKFLGIDRVTIVPIALGEKDHAALLWADKPGSGLASLTKRDLGHKKIYFDHSEIVEVRSLDSWAHETGIWPDVIKIDVEGHEMDVLMGAQKAVKSAIAIQFEFGGCNVDTRTFFRDFWTFFSKNDYEIYRVSRYGPIKVGEYSEKEEIFRTTNFIALRKIMEKSKWQLKTETEL